MPTAYITHPDCLKHETGDFHPESPLRLRAIEDQLIASGILDLLKPYEAPRATEEQLMRVHSERYIRELKGSIPDEGFAMLDPDTPVSRDSYQAALRAAGAGVLGVDTVMSGEVDSAFCAVRPPGHHAERERPMGFCLFNNIAVAAAHGLEAHGLERVAIVDFDVHHGNGTEQIFLDDRRVLLCSSFQYPFYPDTPLRDAPNIVNAPLNAGAYSEHFQAAIQEKWLPALHDFKPELVLVSAGFDGHFEDDMAQLNLVETDYSWVTREIMDIANRYAEGRVVSMLEGGYALSALGRSVVAHIRAMMGI